MTPRVIFTVGHAKRGFADLEHQLAAHHITIIVDVRDAGLLPDVGELSRSELKEISAEAGLGYRWLGDRLGPDPATPPGARAAGIDEALGLAMAGSIALLCVEPEPETCHRARILAPQFEARGHLVKHIRPDGTAVLHQDELEL